MNAAFVEASGKVHLAEVPIPECADDEVLIQVKAIGICGSDLHYFKEGRLGDNVIRSPHILGHECSGIVVRVGKEVDTVATGTRVAIEPGVPCFACSSCLSGRYNLCTSVRFLGVPPHHGAFREYLAHDARFVHPLPDGVSYIQGALVEPMAVAYHAFRRAGLVSGRIVLVVGAGPVGLSCVEMARAFGAAKILVSEVSEKRRQAAKALGADQCIDPQVEDLAAVLSECTSGELCDSVFEASGSRRGITEAVLAARRGGSVAFIGMGPTSTEIPYAQLIRKEIDVRGVYRYAGDFGPVLNLMAASKIEGASWVSHRFTLEEIQTAMEVAGDEAVGKLKVIVEC